MNIYTKSKNKIYILIFCCATTIGLSIIFIWSFIKFLNIKVMSTGTLILGLSIAISRIKPQFNQIIRIHEEEIYFANCYDKVHNPPMDVEIKYNEIVKLTYSGTKIIPMSELLIVETSNEKIYIDFNFNNYMKLWYDIYQKSMDNNPLIKVDERLVKRLELKN